jgi:hypothetical protein
MMAVKLPCEPKLAKAQVHLEPLLIIDWDDTLLPSSFIQNKQLLQVREKTRKFDRVSSSQGKITPVAYILM